MFIYFCDICDKSFKNNQNYTKHLRSNYHHKRCIKIESAKEKSECKGCGCEFLKNSQNYYNHIKRNAFLEHKQYEFTMDGRDYEFKCNEYLETFGSKNPKHITAEEAEMILTKYRMLKTLEGNKNIHKQKWEDKLTLTNYSDDEWEDNKATTLGLDDLKILEQKEQELELEDYYIDTKQGIEVMGSGYRHIYDGDPIYLYYYANNEMPCGYEYLCNLTDSKTFKFVWD